MTHRQWQVLEEFELLELQTPSQESYYLAQVCAVIDRGQVKHPGKVKLKHYILKFVTDKDKAPTAELTPEQAAEMSKARWGAVLKGVKVTKTGPSPSQPADL